MLDTDINKLNDRMGHMDFYINRLDDVDSGALDERDFDIEESEVKAINDALYEASSTGVPLVKKYTGYTFEDTVSKYLHILDRAKLTLENKIDLLENAFLIWMSSPSFVILNKLFEWNELNLYMHDKIGEGKWWDIHNGSIPFPSYVKSYILEFIKSGDIKQDKLVSLCKESLQGLFDGFDFYFEIKKRFIGKDFNIQNDFKGDTLNAIRSLFSDLLCIGLSRGDEDPDHELLIKLSESLFYSYTEVSKYRDDLLKNKTEEMGNMSRENKDLSYDDRMSLLRFPLKCAGLVDENWQDELEAIFDLRRFISDFDAIEGTKESWASLTAARYSYDSIVGIIEKVLRAVTWIDSRNILEGLEKVFYGWLFRHNSLDPINRVDQKKEYRDYYNMWVKNISDLEAPSSNLFVSDFERDVRVSFIKETVENQELIVGHLVKAFEPTFSFMKFMFEIEDKCGPDMKGYPGHEKSVQRTVACIGKLITEGFLGIYGESSEESIWIDFAVDVAIYYAEKSGLQVPNISKELIKALILQIFEDEKKGADTIIAATTNNF